MDTSDEMVYSVGMVAKMVGVQTHTIRYWTKRFPQVKCKVGIGGHRYYGEEEVRLFTKIKEIMKNEKSTILQNNPMPNINFESIATKLAKASEELKKAYELLVSPKG